MSVLTASYLGLKMSCIYKSMTKIVTNNYLALKPCGKHVTNIPTFYLHNNLGR